MTCREQYENKEEKYMSKFACLSSKSKGRCVKEKACKFRTAFQIDRDRIIYSNAFRRLKYKTQVFLNPTGDEYRTRLSHTLEVAQVARTIARAMNLNEDLAEAIALGHDLGHTAFGHGGETILQEIHSIDFSHNKNSIKVVSEIENYGNGLNLTYEVLDGIIKHSKGFGEIIPINTSESASTVEGCIVRISDIIAYINHDLDDSIKSNVINVNEVPMYCLDIIGGTHRERAYNMVSDIIISSIVKNNNLILTFSKRMYKAMNILRNFLYNNIYRSEKIHYEFIKAKKILSELYIYFTENEKELNLEMWKVGINRNNNSCKNSTCDFIASITDRYAIKLYKKIFFPMPII